MQKIKSIFAPLQNFFKPQYVFKPKHISIMVSSLVILSVVGFIFREKISFLATQGADPLAYLKLDEGQGTTTYDSSGENDGTFGSGSSAPTWISDDQCISGKCLRFDGTNDVVNMADTGNLEFAGDFTISMWFRTGSTGSIQNMIGYGTTNDWMYGMYFNADNTLSCKIYQNGNGSGYLEAVTTANYRDNNWYHVSCVGSGNNVYIYINGKLVATGNVTSGSRNTDSTGTFTLGKQNSSTPTHFRGQLDDIKLYDYARTAEQIRQDFAARGTINGVSALGEADIGKKLSHGLIGYWKMDEGIGTTTVDSSGNNVLGTFGPGSSSPSWTTGKFGGALDFDGTSDYVETSSSTSVVTGAFSMAGWVYFDQEKNYQGVFGKFTDCAGSPTIAYDFCIGAGAGGSMWASVTNSAGSTMVQSVITESYAGQWMHLTMVWDGVSTLKFYKNGVLRDSDVGALTLSTDHPVRMGAKANNGRNIDGKIDDVRLYNRVLDQNEVKALYEWAPGPVGYWKMDDAVIGDNQTVIDSSGNGNNGTTEAGAGTAINCTTSGKYGTGCSMDGSDDYITISDPSSGILDVQDGQNFSISFWINRNSYTTGDTVIAKRNGAGVSTAGYIVLIGTNDKVSFTVGDGDGTNKLDVDSVSTIASAGWNHVTIVYDDSAVSASKIYINGVNDNAVATTTGTFASIGDLSNSLTVNIGAESDGDSPFDGSIDDLKFYNYARTHSQIIEDMNAGHPVVGTPVGSTVLHMKLDEGYGGTVNDWSPQNNDGSISGSSAPSWTNNGKFGRALSFDGTDDYVLVPDANSLDIGTSSSASVSVWYYSTASDTTPRIIIGKRSADSSASTDYNIFTESNNLNWGTGTSADSCAWLNIAEPSRNTWHHVLGIIEATGATTGTKKLYVDGVLKSTCSYTNKAASNSSPLTIGRGFAGAQWKGYIDEVKIYPFALSDTEAKLEYNQGKSLVLGSQSTGVGGTTPDNSSSREYCAPGDSSTCGDPVIEWLMNEGQGSNVNDTSGNGNIGTMVSSPIWTTGKKGNSLLFDRNNIVSLTYNTSAPISGSAWIKPLSLETGNIYTVMKRYTAATGDLDFYFRIRESSGFKQEFVHRASGNWQSKYGSIPIVANEWQHVAFTLTSGNVLTMYVNGQISYNQSITVTTSEDPGSTRDFTASDSGNGINGYMDEFRVYNYARTQAQVLWEYNRGAPRAWYKMEEGSGTTVVDWGRNANGGYNGNNGTLGAGNSAPTWTTSGKIGSALSFDGTNDYVSLGSTLSDSQGTITAWIKLDSSSAANTIISAGDISGSTRYFHFRVSNTTLEIAQRDNDTQDLFNANTTISVGNWHHVALVSTGSVYKMYINGVEMNLTSQTGSNTGDWFDNVTGADNLLIGMLKRDTEQYFFDGSIDELKIYNFPLTATQIKTDMKSSAVRFE